MAALASAIQVDAQRDSRTLASLPLALLLMFVSGFAALGYQIVWTQQSALWLGHEAAAVLAVITAFFGGLALGALTLGSRIARSTHPRRWYVACELVIALWAVVLTFGLHPAASALQASVALDAAPLQHWSIVFCMTFVALLPATAAMGATLPAMERVLASLRAHPSRIAWLYAGNTAGAVMGTVIATFVLTPWLGLSATIFVCASANLLCALLAWTVFADSQPAAAAEPSSTMRALPLLAMTGLLGIGYEVLVVRVLSQITENTVYTFAILLTIYLIGTALGAAAFAKWPRLHGRAVPTSLLLQVLAASCLWGMIALAGAGDTHRWLLTVLPSGMSSAIAAEAVLAVLAFLPATIAMGALFSHLSTLASDNGVGFHRALGVNTLGAALAPVVFGVLLLLQFDSKVALALIVLGYLGIAGLRAWQRPMQWALIALTLGWMLWGPSLAIIDVPADGHLVQYREGAMAAVSIVEDARDVATLHINNRQQEGSSATVLADGRQAWIPMLLHPSPHRALFIGLGTGMTAWSAAGEEGVRVDAVELLPEVIAASRYFTRDLDPQHAPHLINADARRFIQVTHDSYDVVVADNFHPARSGSSALYTQEHFAAIRSRLAPGGLFCQWLPLHQLDLPTLRSIIRTYLAVFPNAYALLATNSLETPVVGLIARKDAEQFALANIRERLRSADSIYPPDAFGFEDELSLAGAFIAGPASLAEASKDAPLNTDDRPVVAYLAPRVTYAPDSTPRERVLSVIREWGLHPDEFDLRMDEEDSRRLANYWAARDRFLEIGRDVQPTSDVRKMLTQVREPLLAVLKVSPEFRPAYDPLLRMARALMNTDPASARELLRELQAVQPARPEAAQLLDFL